MKIFLDVSSAAKKEKTGVALYIENLARSLSEEDAENKYSLFCRFSRIKSGKYLPEIESSNFSKIYSPFQLISGGTADIAHGLDGRLLRIGKAKKVVTIHDTFSVVSDEFADARFREKKKKYYREAAEKADAVICDSKNTARDFVSHFSYPVEKIHIVPLGVGEEFRRRARADCVDHLARLGIAEKYILFVGTISTRKNVSALVETFERVVEEIPEISLVIAGKKGFGADECLAKVASSKARNKIVVAGYVDAESMPYLYNGASLFLYPTRYEGFGLPILEAMASGVPIVSSNASSIPEIAGDCAILADCGDTKLLANEVLKVLNDESVREKMVSNGVSRAKEFSWRETAGRTLAVYKCLAGD